MTDINEQNLPLYKDKLKSLGEKVNKILKRQYNPIKFLKRIIVILLIGIIFFTLFSIIKNIQTPKSNPPTKVTEKGLPTPTSYPKFTEISTANWKSFRLDNKISFRYPDLWQSINEIPNDFIIKEFGSPGWENSKMFRDCNGPILQNVKENSTLIVIEVTEQNSDEKFCWSYGDFSDKYTRKINSFDSPQSIDVSRWTINQYQENGVLKTPIWKGDLFEQYKFNNDKLNVVFGLYFQNGRDYTAELVFDKILSSFKFLDPDEESPIGWKTYLDNNYRYQLKYPSEWTLLTEKPAYSLERNTTYIRKSQNDFNINNFIIKASKNQEDIKNISTLIASAQNDIIWKTKPQIDIVTVAGEKTKMLQGEVQGGIWQTKIIILHQSILYEIIWKDKIEREEQKTFEKMLSTLKLMD